MTPERDVEQNLGAQTMRSGTGRRVPWVAAAVVVLILAASTFAVRSRSGSDSQVAAAAAAKSTTTTTNPLQSAFVSVVNRVRPSIVEVETPTGLGSGVVYDNKGDIVTNNHVVEGSTSFQVNLANGKTLNGTLVGQYAPDDLAVVNVSGDSPPPAAFADSSKVQVGDIVLALGNPLGLASSVTEGIISATDRTVSEGGGIVLPSTLQTSASINPGNSGGGLVNMNAAVVGIPTLAATDPQLGGGSAPGIGFAIPSNTVKLIADQLIAKGKVSNSDRASLGITGSTVRSSSGAAGGVVVQTVKEPASGAGIVVGDIVMAVNGAPTLTLSTLVAALTASAPGKQATVKVAHANGSTQTYTLTLGTL